MKPIMLFSIVMITAIILAASFGLHIMPTEPLYKIPADMMGAVLYVCPATGTVWDSVSAGLTPYARYMNMLFFFGTMLLLFGWGWSLYQNLLKDKFEQGAFKTPWMFTKVLFWAVIVITILIATPNHFRRVNVAGAPGEYVLCESNTPGALPVRAAAVGR